MYRHLNFSLNASHTADAATNAVRECRIALRDANPTAQWGGWFQLDHTGHAAVARWAMAGANISNLVGHVRTARPAYVAGLRLTCGRTPLHGLTFACFRSMDGDASDKAGDKTDEHKAGGRWTKLGVVANSFGLFLNKLHDHGMPSGYVSVPPGYRQPSASSWIQQVMHKQYPRLVPRQADSLVRGIGRGWDDFRVVAVQAVFRCAYDGEAVRVTEVSAASEDRPKWLSGRVYAHGTGARFLMAEGSQARTQDERNRVAAAKRRSGRMAAAANLVQQMGTVMAQARRGTPAAGAGQARGLHSLVTSLTGGEQEAKAAVTEQLQDVSVLYVVGSDAGGAAALWC